MSLMNPAAIRATVDDPADLYYDSRPYAASIVDETPYAFKAESHIIYPCPATSGPYPSSPSRRASVDDAPPPPTTTQPLYRSEPLVGAAKSVPKEGQYMGEDLYLVQPLTPRRLILGVFDGVGEWIAHGIDPTDYSQRLVDFFYDEAESFRDEVITGERMVTALTEAHSNALMACKPWGAFGTTTAAIALIDDKTLHTLNLGDSQVTVFRRRSEETFDPVFFTEIQAHPSSAPYQMGAAPTRDDCRQHGIDPRVACTSDQPAEASYESFTLEDDDIIIAATDGLWDNLEPEEVCLVIEEIVTRDGDVVSTASLVDALCSKLVAKARYHAMHGAGPLRPGKNDDITVAATWFKL